MTRSPLFLFALITTATLACRQSDRPDGDVPIDETGDAEDCPGCFDANGMLWNLQVGLEDGAFATVHTSSGDRLPLFTVQLVEQEYFDTSTEDPSAHSCTFTYTPAVAPGSSVPSAMFDWELTLVPGTDGCGDLDPDWVSSELFQDLPGYGWEMVAEALDADLSAWLQDWFDQEGADWAADGAPYYFGLTTLIDGVDAGSGVQGHYGRAYAVDEDMNIASEGTGGSLLTTEQVAAGSDGFYEIYAYKYITPYETLP